MKLTIHIRGEDYRVDPDAAIDLSIPLYFDGPQPNTYGVPPATGQAYEASGFIGDTRRGGGCNFETYQLTPHCNGTHTECVGHISDARIPVAPRLTALLLPATVATVEVVAAAASSDTYRPDLSPSDRLISHAALMAALAAPTPGFLDALVLRTLPNDPSKLSRDYMAEPPPFFSHEAMSLIVEAGVRHLVVDLPSVDRAFDGGLLHNHHLFWGLPEGSHAVAPEAASTKTITEMIYVPDRVRDGSYFLSLQIPAFMTDAAPSRPLLFPIHATD